MEQPIRIDAEGYSLEIAGEVEFLPGRGIPDCIRITAEPSLLDALTLALMGTYDALLVTWGAHRVQLGPVTVAFELGSPTVELWQA